jgi:hypothetical protein
MASIISAGTTSGTALNMAGDTSGQLQLATNGSTTAITIDTSQNVGIGTTTPTEKLEVIGSINVTADASYRIGSGTDRFIKYRVGNSDILYSFDSGDFYRQDIGNSNHSWFTNNAERMRIDSSGNLLVATTAQLGAGRLCVDFNQSTHQAITLRNTNGSNGGNYILFLNSSSNQAGLIGQTGATTVSYTTSSDYRLKENIVPMVGALDKVLQLKPVTYTWKQDGSNGQGFIAHELQAIVPDCVVGEKDAVETYTDEDGIEQTRITPQGVDTSFLVATLTAAIQEQQTIINDLKARVTALEAK